VSDRAAVLVALLAVTGASLAHTLTRPMVWAVVLVCALCVVRTLVVARARPAPHGARVAALALGVAVFVWTTAGAAAALGALRHPPTGTVHARAQLVGDPVPTLQGVRVDVRVDGRRVEATADRALARELLGHLAGERLVLHGTYSPRPVDAPWLDARHIAGRLRIDRVDSWHGASWAGTVANGARRLLARGARPLPAEQRALYTGLVYGDDREQPALLADDFRAGGLGHLLAVSGQNVAFALAAAGPVVRRVPVRARWPVVLAVLVLFVLITRAEPSVLRAATMAAIAARASTLGRTASGVRVLSLAVTTLVCADPLLVRAVGFQLSVAASLGIIVASRPIADRVPGPAAWREAVGVTLAAQLAVAPLSVWIFGGVPLASLPANLLALPAAGVVMVWGLTAGPVAGVLGSPVGLVLHLPTRVLLWWITEVAGAAGRAPLGLLGGRHVAAVLAALAAAVGSGPARRSRQTGATGPGPAAWAPLLRGTAAVVFALALVACVLGARRPPPAAGEVADDVWLWRSGAVVVELGSRPTAPAALRSLREAGVAGIDVLVVRGGGARAATVARDLRARYDPPVLWAPSRHQVRDAVTPLPGTVVRVGRLEVRVLESAERVGVAVGAV
jgi:competence protein ComEC